MIDDCFGHGQAAEKRTEVAELIPRSGIHDDHVVLVSPTVPGLGKNLKPMIRIQGTIAGRKRAQKNESNLFAHLPKSVPKGENGTDPVAVRPDVCGQKKPLMTVNQVDEGSPVNRHAAPQSKKSNDTN